MPLDPRLRLMAIEEQIRACESAFSESWIYLEPISGQPGRAVRKLKPEYETEYNALQARLVELQEMRTELRRELNLDALDLEESYGR
jgi:hypothetical protein